MSYPKQIIYNINYQKILIDLIFSKKSVDFVDNFKSLINAGPNKNLVMLGRARGGIYLAVKQAIKIKKSNLVFLSPYTIQEVIDLVVHAGGNPYFIDFEKDTTFLDLNLLNNEMKRNPAAVILTHYNTNQIYYEEISNIIKKYNSVLIEDSALSISGKSKGKDINSLSDFSIFSFSSFKLLNCFYGGAILINNHSNNELISEINSWPNLKIKDYISQFYRTILFDLAMNKFFYKRFTVNYLKRRIQTEGLSDFVENKLKIEKALINESYFTKPLNFVLKELDRKTEYYKIQRSHRIKIAKIYYKNLQSISINNNGSLLQNINESDNFNYLIKCKNENHRDQLRSILIKQDYHVGKLFYENCHKLKRFNKMEGNSDNVTDLMNKLIVLPTHYLIKEQYASELSEIINNNY